MILIKRIVARNLSDLPQKKDQEGRLICVECGKLLTSRQRKYCSDICSHETWVKNNHQSLRLQIAKDNNYICKKCGIKFSIDNLILDHIKPIALGGGEFDKTNVQILCRDCNKLKTRNDLKLISIERKIPNNQIRLI